jgi:hypothetical protein
MNAAWITNIQTWTYVHPGIFTFKAPVFWFHTWIPMSGDAAGNNFLRISSVWLLQYSKWWMIQSTLLNNILSPASGRWWRHTLQNQVTCSNTCIQFLEETLWIQVHLPGQKHTVERYIFSFMLQHLYIQVPHVATEHKDSSIKTLFIGTDSKLYVLFTTQTLI